jgi:hypothetical protein
MMHRRDKSRNLGFRVHLFVFVLSMLIQTAINVWLGPPYWVLWVLPGWGVGLAAHWWFLMGPGARRSGTI